MITDTHLENSNTELVVDIFKQTIAQALKYKFDTIYHLGDFFDSRKSQTLAVLEAAREIFEMLEKAGIEMRTIPGNHSKPDYHSEGSYLDIFERYESLTLVREYGSFMVGDVCLHMIPFFDEKKSYGKYLNRALDSIEDRKESVKKDLLLTHIAVDGVRNNDGSEIEDTLSPNRFKAFSRVFCGHYHCKQETGNVLYIGSAYQRNFGEDADKGLSLLYSNGEVERISLDFPIFETVKIDLNSITDDELKALTDDRCDTEDRVRFKFSGTKEKLSSLDKGHFNRLGIDVKTEVDDPLVDLDYAELSEFEGFDTTSILEEWDSFTKKHEIHENIAKDGKERITTKFNEQ